MRTTVTIDDKLLARAQEVTGIKERSLLLKEALTRLIQDEAARRLIALGEAHPIWKHRPDGDGTLTGHGEDQIGINRSDPARHFDLD